MGAEEHAQQNEQGEWITSSTMPRSEGVAQAHTKYEKTAVNHLIFFHLL